MVFAACVPLFNEYTRVGRWPHDTRRRVGVSWADSPSEAEDDVASTSAVLLPLFGRDTGSTCRAVRCECQLVERTDGEGLCHCPNDEKDGRWCNRSRKVAQQQQHSRLKKV